ncbi:UPF0481 protein [Ananas comosus]|uniref:UPF0481 protein n=1 Tax=Ananas comosus TaxID=4615 RepID=A0A199VVS6_ANACO|nr:UPF0481 protein [Ananas comosus]
MEGVLEGELAIDIREALLSSARGKLSVLSKESMASDKCTIFRAPTLIRQRNKHLYEPQTVAVGPYGRRDDKPSLQAMEWLKWCYLQEFLSRNYTNTIEDYVAEIQKLVPEVRGCYFERVELNPVEFVEMLLLDGCFILEFLIKWKLGVGYSFFTSEWSLSLVHDDLLLLENQIPLPVLDKLFERLMSTMGSGTPSLMELLVDYLTRKSVESPEEETKRSKNGKKQANCGTCWLASHFWSPEEESIKKTEEETKEPRKWEAKNFHHLLHLYYECYVTAPQTSSKLRTDPKDGDEKILPRTIPSATELLEAGDGDKKIFPRTIPSATELLDAGVTLKKKKKKNENETHEKRHSAFLDVAFEDGVLEIPFLSVEPSTLTRFSNLVAFEQCGGCDSDKAYMTSYAMFMNCLIDKREDVAVLHQRGILENNLASDEELAVFFNQLSDLAYVDYDDHYLAELFRDVRDYCGYPWPKWRAKLVRDYFSNPWAILSLFAAAVLLILTILQTVYTIYPYYHPVN